MVQLMFDLHGYYCQRGILTIRDSFAATSASLRSVIANLEQRSAEYEAKIAINPSARIGEWEDGRLLWDQSQVFEMDIESANEALMALRKAYAISTYHHWERHARKWTNARRLDNHKEICRRSLDMGYPIHKKLQDVALLANTLKHDSAVKGEELARSWPEVLPVRPAGLPITAGWYEAVQLSDLHVAEICDVVAASTPTHRISATNADAAAT